MLTAQLELSSWYEDLRSQMLYSPQQRDITGLPLCYKLGLSATQRCVADNPGL